MNITYEVQGMPDGLPPGEYGARVKEVKRTIDGATIVLVYNGEIDPKNPTLFTINYNPDDK